MNENIKAYGVATHRHTPEIEEQLGYAAGKEILVNFTPHLVPMNRGILVTEYATLTKRQTARFRLMKRSGQYMINTMQMSISCVSWKRMYARRQNG